MLAYVAQAPVIRGLWLPSPSIFPPVVCGTQPGGEWVGRDTLFVPHHLTLCPPSLTPWLELAPAGLDPVDCCCWRFEQLLVRQCCQRPSPAQMRSSGLQSHDFPSQVISCDCDHTTHLPAHVPQAVPPPPAQCLQEQVLTGATFSTVGKASSTRLGSVSCVGLLGLATLPHTTTPQGRQAGWEAPVPEAGSPSPCSIAQSVKQHPGCCLLVVRG